MPHKPDVQNLKIKKVSNHTGLTSERKIEKVKEPIKGRHLVDWWPFLILSQKSNQLPAGSKTG